MVLGLFPSVSSCNSLFLVNSILSFLFITFGLCKDLSLKSYSLHVHLFYSPEEHANGC